MTGKRSNSTDDSDKARDIDAKVGCKYDLVFHELGVPPIHTPGETLAALPKESRDRLRVVHVGKSLCPEGLLTGIEGDTIDLECDKDKIPNEADTLRKLMFLSNVQFFQEVSFKDSHRLIQMVEKVRFSQGDEIVKQGDVATHFYVLIKGRVSRRRLSHGILKDRIIERMLCVPDRKEITKLEYVVRVLHENPHFTAKQAIEKVEHTYGSLSKDTIDFLYYVPTDVDDDVVDYNELRRSTRLGNILEKTVSFRLGYFISLANSKRKKFFKNPRKHQGERKRFERETPSSIIWQELHARSRAAARTIVM